MFAEIIAGEGECREKRKETDSLGDVHAEERKRTREESAGFEETDRAARMTRIAGGLDGRGEKRE